MKVPITFEHQGKIYKGSFSSVSGAGGALWNLMINNYYYGQMFYSEGCNCWIFKSNSGKFEDLSDYFEAYMIGWFG